MSVYVDPLFDTPHSASWRYDQSCHMTADTLDELHEMADAIGHKRAWFQDKPGFPHYDLTPSRRKLAVKFGAIEIDCKEMFRRYCERLKESGNAIPPPSTIGGPSDGA